MVWFLLEDLGLVCIKAHCVQNEDRKRHCARVITSRRIQIKVLNGFPLSSLSPSHPYSRCDEIINRENDIPFFFRHSKKRQRPFSHFTHLRRIFLRKKRSPNHCFSNNIFWSSPETGNPELPIKTVSWMWVFLRPKIRLICLFSRRRKILGELSN